MIITDTRCTLVRGLNSPVPGDTSSVVTCQCRPVTRNIVVNMKSAQKNQDTRTSLVDLYREACTRGVNLKFRIVTGSMAPIIGIGDKVEVTWTEPDRIRLGDIVAFRCENDVIVHRVTGKARGVQGISFRNCGDAEGSPTSFHEDDLIGCIIKRIRDRHSVSLTTLSSRISGWLLALRIKSRDYLDRVHPRCLGTFFRLIFRPFWLISRGVIFNDRESGNA